MRYSRTIITQVSFTHKLLLTLNGKIVLPHSFAFLTLVSFIEQVFYLARQASFHLSGLEHVEVVRVSGHLGEGLLKLFV